MNKDETIKVLSVLKAAYPNVYQNMPQETMKETIALWQAMFSTDPYAEVIQAVKALIASRTNSFPPVVGEVREEMHKLKPKSEQMLSDSEAWAMVSKACRNGYYGYLKEYAKLPPEVQAAVGAPEQLRYWANCDPETLETVVASNFKKEYRAKAAVQHHIDLMTPDIQQLVQGISVRIGGGVMKELPDE